jgi:DNA-binding winged helix-turn-helix (wHTH) protein
VKYAFGEFVYDAQRCELTGAGHPIPIANKPLEMLALLLNEAGLPVSKKRIYEALWGDAIVEDSNLTQTAYVLRKALSQRTPGRVFIRTVPKLGYQFVEPVRRIADAPRRWRVNWNPKTSRLQIHAAATILDGMKSL